MMSTDSDEEESVITNKINKGNESSDSDDEPEEFEIVNSDGSITKMITTASGPIPLDFSNTKII